MPCLLIHPVGRRATDPGRTAQLVEYPMNHLLMRVSWVLRVLSAGLCGAVIRAVRRLRGLPPRIWHGILPLHMTQGQVQADRAAGYPSHSVVKTARSASYALVAVTNFDRVVQ